MIFRGLLAKARKLSESFEVGPGLEWILSPEGTTFVLNPAVNLVVSHI